MFALFRDGPEQRSPAVAVEYEMPTNLRWVAQLSAALRLGFGFFAAEYSKKYLARTRVNEIIES
jgi:hypothetical protein